MQPKSHFSRKTPAKQAFSSIKTRASPRFLSWCRHEHQRLVDEFYVSGLAPDTKQRLLDQEIEARAIGLDRPSKRQASSSTRIGGSNHKSTLFTNCSNENCEEPRLCKLLSKGQACQFLTKAPKVVLDNPTKYKLRPRRKLSYGHLSFGQSMTASSEGSSMGVTPLNQQKIYRTSSPVKTVTKKKPPPKLTLSTIKKQRKSATNISLQVFTGAESELLNASDSIQFDSSNQGSSPKLRRVNSSSPRNPQRNQWLLNNGLNLSQDLSSICNKTGVTAGSLLQSKK